MKTFDITTTATLRPDLLKRTFNSHIEHLFGDHIKKANLIINIDKIGCKKRKERKKVQKIMEYISSLPFKRVSMNVSDQPHFPSAICWCLSKIGEPLTFHLEEDWELTQKIDFEAMVREFENNETLAHLRLSAFNSTEKHQLKTWNKFCKWNGSWYEVPHNLKGTIGFCGHPSLNRTSFLRFFYGIMDKSKNPEKQIKGNYPEILRSRFGVFQKQLAPASIKDIGRQWMITHGFKKEGSKAWFTNWCKAK